MSFTYRGRPVKIPNLPHHLPRAVQQSGSFYEADLLEHLERAVPHGGVWVDVGANIGNHTIFFSRYTADRVISLEPNPDNCAALRATVAANELTNVQVCEFGASDTACTARMSLPSGFEDNPGAYTITADGPIVVRVERLDTVLAMAGPVRLIKIDTEGHELQALRGASAILRRDRPHLAIEAHTKADLAALMSLLSPLGYRVVVRCGWTPTYHLAPWTWAEKLRFRLGVKRRRLE